MAASSSSSNEATLQSLKYSRAANTLEVLDQLLVPHETSYVAVAGSEDAWGVIRRMQVRGAPLIAIVAALGLSVEAQSSATASAVGDSAAKAEAFLLEKMEYLRTSRPTAVNLFTATDELSALVKAAAAAGGATAASVLTAYSDAAEAMLAADVNANRAIGSFGAEAILEAKKAAGGAAGAGSDPVVSVMTICNTGSLATAGYGTALGVVRALHEVKPLNASIIERMDGWMDCDRKARRGDTRFVHPAYKSYLLSHSHSMVWCWVCRMWANQPMQCNPIQSNPPIKQ